MDCTYAENRHLRRIEQRRKALDPERLEIANGEGRAGEIIGGDSSCDRLRRQLASAGGKLIEREMMRVADYGHQEPARCIAGEPDVDVRVLPNVAVHVFGIE